MMWETPGRVRVTIERADGLRNVQTIGKQDPYVKGALLVGTDDELRYHAARQESASLLHRVFGKGTKQADQLDTLEAAKSMQTTWKRTRTVDDGGSNPDWSSLESDEAGLKNELVFRYPGRDESQGEKPTVRVLLCVMDAETIRDREIGACFLNLEETLKEGETRKQTVVALEKNAGKLTVTVEFESWPAVCLRGIFHLVVKKAENLRQISSNFAEDPYVTVELAPWHCKGRNEALKQAGTNPVWSENQGHVVLQFPGCVNKSAAESFPVIPAMLSVFDQNIFNRDECMGRGWVNLRPYMESYFVEAKEKKEKKSAQPLTVSLWDPQHGVEPAGTVQISISFEPLFVNEDPAMELGTAGAGKRKALLIGINYEGQESPLRGCHNDVMAVQSMLQGSFGVSEMKVLLDTKGAAKSSLPTAENIKKGLGWLIQGVKPGDKLYLHYSGHGTQVPDYNGDEDDGKDESLVPLDFSFNDPTFQVTDDWLRENFFDRVPKGVDLTVCFDCCHSGTLADNLSKLRDRDVMAQMTSFGGKFFSSSSSPSPSSSSSTKTPQGEETRSRFLPPCEAALQKIEEFRATRARETAQRPLLGFPFVSKRAKGVQKTKKGSSIVVVSGCRDDQTAADAYIDGKYMGATTWSIMSVMKMYSGKRGVSLNDLLREMRSKMKERKWTQEAQLHYGTGKSSNSFWLEGWSSDSTSSFGATPSSTILEDHESGDQAIPTGEETDQSRSFQVEREQDSGESDAEGDDFDGVVDLAQEKSDGRNICNQQADEVKPDLVRPQRNQNQDSVATNKTVSAEGTGVSSDEEEDYESYEEDFDVHLRKPAWSILSNHWNHPSQSGKDAEGTSATGKLGKRRELLSLVRRKSRISIAPSQGERSCSSSSSSKLTSRRRVKPDQQPVKTNPPKSKRSQPNDSQRSFLERMDTIAQSKEEKLRKQRAKEDYDARLDKKVCMSCQVEQSYAEVEKRRKNCQRCGAPYRRRLTWTGVQDGFLQRNLKKG